MSLTVEDGGNTKKKLENLIKGLPEAARAASQDTLQTGERQAKTVVHVITGRLRDSIRTENITQNGGDLVAGGTGEVDYAIYEELGNVYREGHPFLRPSLEYSMRDGPKNLKKKIDNLMR